MEYFVEELYLRGDTSALIAIAQRAGDPANDAHGAQRALKLLARLGDPQAIAFCQTVPGPLASSDAA